MKITNGQIVNIFNGVPKIMKKRLPVKFGFAISKNMAAMQSAAESYDAEIVKLLEKYGKKDESGQFMKDVKEYILSDKQAYTDEVKELMDIENEIQIHTVSMDEIEKCDSEKFDALTPAELSLLEFMIFEE